MGKIFLKNAMASMSQKVYSCDTNSHVNNSETDCLNKKNQESKSDGAFLVNRYVI